MADARPPPAAETPSASALMGSYPIDEDALRKWKRLHDDGVIDDDEFKRGKVEALGLAVTTASSGALSRLPEDLLRNVLSFLVLKQEGIAQRFLENVREMQRGVFDCLESLDDDPDDDTGTVARFAVDLIRDGDVSAKQLRKDIVNCISYWPVSKDFARIFRKVYPDLRLDPSGRSKNSASSAVKLKWSRWMDEFNKLTYFIDEELRQWNDIREESEFNWWETPHVHVLELMAAFDGLDDDFIHNGGSP